MRKRLEQMLFGVLGAIVASLFIPVINASYIPLPQNAIVHFDLTTAAGCPAGWTELTAARGAYITGLVNGGTKGTLVGTALTDQENRNHTHTVPALSISASGVLDLTTGATNSTQIGFNGASGHLIVRSGGTNQQDNNELQAAGGAIDTNPIGAATHTHGGSTGTGTSGNNNITPAPYLQYLTCKKS